MGLVFCSVAVAVAVLRVVFCFLFPLFDRATPARKFRETRCVRTGKVSYSGVVLTRSRQAFAREPSGTKKNFVLLFQCLESHDSHIVRSYGFDCH